MSDGDGVRISPLPPGFGDMLPGPELVAALAPVDRNACNGFEVGEQTNRQARNL
ncbi:hypothetical protein [Actinopolymorpha alba]|uniref:hypothetical protein n=1 Tax=Actinopolymorpha alba TaxID=533267 RepID=UPI000399CD77|nr:hypothetical protein [Actinopolymorpha alba]